MMMTSGIGELGGLMRQAKAMQDHMQQAQKKLAKIEVTGESGAGLVSVSMTCRYGVKRVSVAPELLGDEPAVLEELIAAAFNDAVHKVEATTQETMGGITAGLDLSKLTL